MPLATRCPHCETVFRIQPEHLTLHGGLARCGHCQQVFDAAHSLVAPDPELAPAIVETTPAAAGTPPQPPRVFSATAPQATPAQAADGNFTPGAWDMWAPWLDGGIDPKLRHNSGNTDATPLVPIAAVPAGEVPASEAGLMRGAPAAAGPAAASIDDPAGHADANAAASATLAPAHTASAADIAALVAALPRDAAEPSLGAAPSPVDTDMAEPQADDVRVHLAPRSATPPEAEPFAAEPEADGRVHFAMTRESPAAARGSFGRQVLGGFLAGLLLVLFLGQLAWWLREPLLARWPAAQPLFAQACATLGCTLEPPRAIDGLRLGASDLRQLDGPRVLELKVPLSNHASIALAWPSIELTLLDASNQVAARRVLPPADYVRPGTPLGAGLAAGATETLFVRIDTAPGAADGAPGIAASNFRVQIFYP
ncbi:zinc-ribbon and DUF3426 domain-containing protein [Burkholderia gladioli]|jgi:predicted Zn finger-like uncharacterized protein|uniref:zinc-ribbon and DUF3426 domain-containing protein n=1 Tax=Burkholderia gladioli TaxID=28095 RepID=UPI000CDA6B4A|nr:zinc-ribbon and DUF3426 domain-containing protein [Burkholderia gladioli]KAF1064112.1 hypothetical protein LvStA_02768 [Burkholderia gladioli]MDN7601897.1 zinc-ribbon and DUF3426 domain-containing protein [Burkholderia gladioli]POS04815.1 DUF3426 domain-containing protein [Burkholderia gladioli]WAG20290.1 DUF3426 domain-containing protein [Burkholderia gladioli]